MPRPIPIALVALSATVCATIMYVSLPQSQAAQAPVPMPTATPPALFPPLLTVPDAPGNTQAVAIEKADILLQAIGPLMKTTITLRFGNITDRVLEGELAFPLPEGAVLSGYALDVNGEMADAVPVPKEEARVIFETEARKGVDPGLVEQTQGNNFRTRIYPIPAKGTRTIRLSFISEAASTGKGESTVSLPLRWNQTVPLLSVKIQSDAPTTITLGGKDREMVREETSGSLSKTLENVVVNGDMAIRVQTGKSPALRDGVMTETFTKPNGIAETYFAVLEQTPAPSTNAPVVRPGRHIGLLWDASLSRRTANIERELRFLETVAREKWRDTTVQVVVLRDKQEAGGAFVIANGDATKLIAFLRKQSLDGGTTYRDLHLAGASQPDTQIDYWVAFTDGLDTLGGGEKIKADAPLWIVNSDSKSDSNLLRAMAVASGGNYVNLPKKADTDRDVSRTIGESPYSLLSTTVDDGKVEGLTSKGITPVKGANSVAIAGRLVSDAATMTLHYGYPGGKSTVERTVTLRKPEANAASSGLVGYVWAQRTADALSVEPKQNRDTLRQIGQNFGIVTPGTSLLVLETLEQCLEYGIAPARTRKKLYAQYVSTVETRGVAKRQEAKSRLEQTVARWKDRVKYWGTDFDYAATLRGRAKRKAAERGRVEEERVGVERGEGYFYSSGRAGSAPTTRSLSTSARSNLPVALGQAPASSSAQFGVRGGAGGGAPITSANGAPGVGATRNRPQQVARLASIIVADGAAPAPKKADSDQKGTASVIAIKPWSPNAPYIKKMAAAKTADDAYAIYLAGRKAWLETPAYYFDCAQELHRRGSDALAVRVLTGIADLRLEDAALLRIVAHRLVQWGHTQNAIPLFEQVADLRPEEPQSFRDLALAVADRGDSLAKTNPAQAITHYNRALQLLNKVAVNRWDRFEGISDIAVTEANRIVARAKRLPNDAATKLIVPLDSRLVRNIESDLRIVMTWDADNTDMDLHVVEPSGEECYYSHNRTAIGGRMSDDFTQGYGPEEYFVRRNMSGKYRIRTNYYGSSEQKITGGTTVQATVFTDWGRPTEKRQSLSLRLTNNKEMVTIGDVTVN